MDLKKVIRTTKYLNRIYIWITTTILLVLLIFSVIVYKNVEKTVLQNEYQSNQKFLYQVKYNIDYMDEMIKNFCISAYFNNDIVSLMSGKEIGFEDLVIKINRIKSSVVNYSSFVHSVYIYNNKNKSFYSTYKDMYYVDNELEKLIDSYKAVPKMRPVLRKIEASDSTDGKKNEDVFTYFMFDRTDENNKMDGGLVVNIKPEWLFNNIKMISMIGRQSKDKVFILNDKKEFIDNNTGDEKFKINLKNIYDKHVNFMASGDKIGFFTDKIGGKNYLITYIPVEKAGWILLKTQAYDEVYEYMNKLKISIVLITILFMALTVIISLSVSRQIYRPIGNLVEQVISGNKKGMDIDKSRDDIAYLNETYKHSMEQLKLYDKEKSANKKIMKTYFLRKLLVDSFSISKEEFDKIKEENDIDLALDGSLAVCVVKIDNYKDSENKYSSQDIELYKFAVINIMTELLSGCFKNEAIDMKNDQIAVILNVDTDTGEYCSKLTELIKQTQENILKYFRISISAAFSGIIKDSGQLTKLYNLTLDNSMYRYVFGRMSVITPDMVKQNRNNTQLYYSFSLDRKLIEEIKSGNLKSAEDVLLNILNEISRLNYNNILLNIMHLVNTVKNTIDEINQARLNPVIMDFDSLNRKIQEFETIDEFYSEIMGVLSQVTGEEENFNNKKHLLLVETIKDIIYANYFDCMLSLQEISSIMKMSSAHIGRIFKENMQIPIPEYINEVRMKKALVWLENSKLSIDEIMIKVGIENRSYFFKLFKKRFGTTPREYVLNKTLKQIGS